MTAILTIEVSQLPPGSASPNSRIDRRAASGDRRVYREAVYYSAMEAAGRTDQIPTARGQRRVSVTFIFAARRRRDRDNMIARFKSGLDALVLADLLVDDSPEYLAPGGVTMLVDPDRAPMTIIEITEGE